MSNPALAISTGFSPVAPFAQFAGAQGSLPAFGASGPGAQGFVIVGKGGQLTALPGRDAAVLPARFAAIVASNAGTQAPRGPGAAFFYQSVLGTLPAVAPLYSVPTIPAAFTMAGDSAAQEIALPSVGGGTGTHGPRGTGRGSGSGNDGPPPLERAAVETLGLITMICPLIESLPTTTAAIQAEIDRVSPRPEKPIGELSRVQLYRLGLLHEAMGEVLPLADQDSFAHFRLASTLFREAARKFDGKNEDRAAMNAFLLAARNQILAGSTIAAPGARMAYFLGALWNLEEASFLLDMADTTEALRSDVKNAQRLMESFFEARVTSTPLAEGPVPVVHRFVGGAAGKVFDSVAGLGRISIEWLPGDDQPVTEAVTNHQPVPGSWIVRSDSILSVSEGDETRQLEAGTPLDLNSNASRSLRLRSQNGRIVDIATSVDGLDVSPISPSRSVTILENKPGSGQAALELKNGARFYVDYIPPAEFTMTAGTVVVEPTDDLFPQTPDRTMLAYDYKQLHGVGMDGSFTPVSLWGERLSVRDDADLMFGAVDIRGKVQISATDRVEIIPTSDDQIQMLLLSPYGEMRLSISDDGNLAPATACGDEGYINVTWKPSDTPENRNVNIRRYDDDLGRNLTNGSESRAVINGKAYIVRLDGSSLHVTKQIAAVTRDKPDSPTVIMPWGYAKRGRFHIVSIGRGLEVRSGVATSEEPQSVSLSFTRGDGNKLIWKKGDELVGSGDAWLKVQEDGSIQVLSTGL